MNRLISLCLAAALLSAGCGGDDKDKNASSPEIPPVGDRFDKSKEAKGKAGPKFD